MQMPERREQQPSQQELELVVEQEEEPEDQEEVAQLELQEALWQKLKS